jgi:hypothetical protein
MIDEERRQSVAFQAMAKALHEVLEGAPSGAVMGMLANRLLKPLLTAAEAAQIVLDHDQLGVPGTRILAACMADAHVACRLAVEDLASYMPRPPS